jgi:EmrB/QacA subfamily drug resistance transporter
METDRSTRPPLVLIIMCIANLLVGLDLFIVNVGLDDIARGVGEASLSNLSWVLNAYAIFFCALLVPAGRLADRFGRKEWFIGGMAVLVAASIGAGVADSLPVVVACRALQAVGAAIVVPASLGIVLTVAPRERRETYVRAWATSAAFSAAAGPVVGGLLIELSWRWMFFMNVPIGLLAIAAAIPAVPRSRDEAATGLPDLRGGLLFVVAIGALALGLVKAPDWGWTAATTLSAFAVCVVALGGFLASSARHPAPVIDLGLLRDSVFSSANLANVLFYTAFAALLLSVILFMRGVWGYSAVKTGLCVAPGPLAVAPSSLLCEQLAKRVPVGVLCAAGFAALAGGVVLLLSSVGTTPDYAGAFLPGWITVGLAVGFVMPTIPAAATARLPDALTATGSAVVTMAGQIGSVLGVSLLVVILGGTAGPIELSAFKDGWWFSAAVGATGVVCALGLGIRPVRARLGAAPAAS